MSFLSSFQNVIKSDSTIRFAVCFVHDNLSNTGKLSWMKQTAFILYGAKDDLLWFNIIPVVLNMLSTVKAKQKMRARHRMHVNNIWLTSATMRRI